MTNIKHFLGITGILTCFILSNVLTAAGKMSVEISASNHNISYSCRSNSVKAIPPVIVISPLPHRCAGGAILLLNNYVTVDGSFKIGGIWTSNSPGLMSGDRFDPKIAGPGIWLVIYEYTDTVSKLSDKDTAQVTIIPLPKVFAGNDSMICSGNGKVALSGSPTYPNGYWRGSGVEIITGGYVFNPLSPGIINGGIYPLIYHYSDNYGCNNEDTINITVYRTPVVEAGPDQNIGLDASPVTLGGDPPGGIWSGPGIVGNIFYPSTVGTGNYHLVYIYTNVICCMKDSIKVSVTPVSIPEYYSPESVTVLPNPAHFYTVISLKGNFAKIESIKLSNALGLRVLYYDKIFDTDFKIKNPGTEKGIYFLEIKLSGSRVIYKKIIFE